MTNWFTVWLHIHSLKGFQVQLIVNRHYAPMLKKDALRAMRLYRNLLWLLVPLFESENGELLIQWKLCYTPWTSWEEHSKKNNNGLKTENKNICCGKKKHFAEHHVKDELNRCFQSHNWNGSILKKEMLSLHVYKCFHCKTACTGTSPTSCDYVLVYYLWLIDPWCSVMWAMYVFFNAAQTCLYNNKDNLLCILTEAQSKLWKTSL